MLIIEAREPNLMPERFTETLRDASEPDWSHAVGHRFVKELFTGAMSDVVMTRYLIQDHRAHAERCSTRFRLAPKATPHCMRFAPFPRGSTTTMTGSSGSTGFVAGRPLQNRTSALRPAQRRAGPGYSAARRASGPSARSTRGLTSVIISSIERIAAL